MGLAALYPQISNAGDGAARAPGCDVPRGYDCTTPGFESPLTLDEAIEISKVETVVYLYGPGLQDARLAARVVSRGKNAPAVPAIAAPGTDVPQDAFYVMILGRLIKHRTSGEPVAFYQRFIDRGEVFALTRDFRSRIAASAE